MTLHEAKQIVERAGYRIVDPDMCIKIMLKTLSRNPEFSNLQQTDMTINFEFNGKEYVLHAYPHGGTRFDISLSRGRKKGTWFAPCDSREAQQVINNIIQVLKK